MKGKTNSQTGGDKGDSLIITLTSNQSDKSDLTGAVITIAYGNESMAYTWDGNMVFVKIPQRVNYTVSVSAVEGYSQPASYSGTSSNQGNLNPLTFTYNTEVVSVRLSSSGGSSVNGASVTINGKKYTWNGSVITQKIAYGTSYTISVGSLSGLKQPSAQSFTAGQSEREVSFVYIESTLVVNILSNQSGDTEISSIKATVKYGSTSVQVSNGEKINIPIGSQTISITFPDRSGWKKPSDISFTNRDGGDYVKSGTYQTEVVFVSTYADSGSPVGHTTTVKLANGTVIGTSDSGMLVCSIPSGSQYIVSCSEIPGFAKPADQIFTAASTADARRDIYMGYIKDKEETLVVNVYTDDNQNTDGLKVNVFNVADCPYGVYIQDTGYNLWTASSWDGSKTANGIAVVTKSCSFVISLDYERISRWSYEIDKKLMSGVTTTKSSSEAVKDYKGKDNTDQIISQTTTTSTHATKIVADYSFPDGRKGYLGAAGEWKAVFDNLDDINSALEACGEYLITGSYWTSTQYDANNAWVATEGTFNVYDKISTTYVRPFVHFVTSKVITDGKATFTIPSGTEYEVGLSPFDGYDAPLKSFTALDGTRTVDMQYTFHGGTKVPSNGVYIHATDGNFFTDGVPSNKTVNGIAVITDSCRFVMALENAYVNTVDWGEYAVLVEDIVTTSYRPDAIKDLNGYDNTYKIIQQLGVDTGTAAASVYCDWYYFPNGRKGYLGAAGEWQAVIDNINEVNRLIGICGGDGLSNDYWTSTQANASYAWCVVKSSYYSLRDYPKNSPLHVRAFTWLGN